MRRNATDESTPSDLPGQQEAVLAALLTGNSITAAASDAGITRQTVHRWLAADAGFIAAYNAGRRELANTHAVRILAMCGAALDVLEGAMQGAWTQDAERRVEAGIPVELRFASKITLAEQMLARAFQAAVPARWVVADSFYGRSGAFRRWLEERGRAYAVMIPRTNAIQYQGGRIRVEQLAERLSEPDSSPWQCLALSEECTAGMGRWLLIRHDADDPSPDAYWRAYGPEVTEPEELIRVCEARWQVEECFAQTKGEVGMDHYEVRTWVAWHRFVTLCLVAHAYLAVVRHAVRCEENAEKGAMLAT